MHLRDRAFNSVNFARKDRMFLSGRGSFAGTSPVRATSSPPYTSRYPSSTSFVPSYNPLNLLALILPACFSTVLPAYPSENFLRTILPFFSPILIFIPRRRPRNLRLTLHYHALFSPTLRPFSPFLEAAFLPHVPTHMNNYFARQKSSLAVLSSARVLFCYLTLRACRVKVE